MEEKVESMERSMEGFKELLDEAASIALLLEERRAEHTLCSESPAQDFKGDAEGLGQLTQGRR